MSDETPNGDFKLIIAGGRDFVHSEKHYTFIERLLQNKINVTFVSGEATGADEMNWIMAERLLAGYKGFPANWGDLKEEPCRIKVSRSGKEYNALAGFNRNERMAQYADALLLFPGGSGSADMLERAKAHNLIIRHYRGK